MSILQTYSEALAMMLVSVLCSMKKQLEEPAAQHLYALGNLCARDHETAAYRAAELTMKRIDDLINAI